MNRIILLALLLTFSFAKTFSQCPEPTTPKILLVGDSWAWFMNNDATFTNVLKKYGHSNYSYFSNSTLAVNGAQTNDIMKATTEAEILNQLTLNPTINVVHLSIGGNDFLGDWHVSNTQGATDTLFNQVFGRLDSIFRFIKSCKPGIQILYSGYVYPNFAESIETSISPMNHPFYNTWSGMEFPTYIQINTILTNVCLRMDTVVAADPQLHFFKCPGLMQYLHGQLVPVGGNNPPAGTYAPFTVPMPFGNPNFPSPITTMRDYGIAKDCYHLSPQGYKDLIAYHTQKFYQKFLMDDLYLLSANNTQTGSVSSTGNIADSLVLGEAGGEQFSAELTFNTTTMADTTLSKASIFLRRKSLSGTNPISGSLQVKVKNGMFGGSVNVEATDLTDAADASGNPCLFGSNTGDGDWIRLDLPAQLLSHITHAAATQFIISAPGFTGGKVIFNNSTDPELAPVLNLVYGQTPSGINEPTGGKEFYIYPNPTTNLLTIEKGNETITHLDISNMLGEVVLHPQMAQNTIDISSLAAGIYMLNITTKNGRTSQRVVKE